MQQTHCCSQRDIMSFHYTGNLAATHAIPRSHWQLLLAANTSAYYLEHTRAIHSRNLGFVSFAQTLKPHEHTKQQPCNLPAGSLSNAEIALVVVSTKSSDRSVALAFDAKTVCAKIRLLAVTANIFRRHRRREGSKRCSAKHLAAKEPE